MEKQIDQIQELTLLLLYLTAWKENTQPTLRPKPVRLDSEDYRLRSWKGYDFDVLDILSELGYIEAISRKAPLIITPQGECRAKELLEKYM